MNFRELINLVEGKAVAQPTINEAPGVTLSDDQMYQIIKYASSGSRIVADGKTIWPGIASDMAAMAQAQMAWKKNGDKLTQKLKTGVFRKIVVKDWGRRNWETTRTIELV